jgi:hypothetical protein
MDDLRKRYDVPRRDYGAPSQTAQPPAPVQQIPISGGNPPDVRLPLAESAYPAQSQPQSYPPMQTDQSQYLPPSPEQQPQDYAQTYHRPAIQTTDESQIQAPTKRKIGLKTAGIGVTVAVLLVVGAVFILKPKKTAAVMPSDLAKKATFDVYYPSSLPTGYTYRQDLATYENGGAYYTFVKGPKHIIIRENVTSTGKLDTNEVTDPKPLETAAGKAVIGTNTGQTAAAVLAGKTYVFIYSNNSVPEEEITAIVQNLANISQNK